MHQCNHVPIEIWTFPLLQKSPLTRGHFLSLLNLLGTLVVLLQDMRTAAAAAPGTLLEMHILGPYPGAQNQKLWVGPRNLFLMSPPGDVDECFSRKAIAPGHLGFLKNRQLGGSRCLIAAPGGLPWDPRRPHCGLSP